MHGLETIIAMNDFKPYRVWHVLERPENGDRIMAVSSFDARRRYAYKHTCGYQDCAARREEADI